MAFPHIETDRTDRLGDSDLDRVIAARRAALLPAGCDQQGRHDTRPEPAEACTELGADDIDPQATAVFWSLYITFALVAITAAVAAMV